MKVNDEVIRVEFKKKLKGRSVPNDPRLTWDYPYFSSYNPSNPYANWKSISDLLKKSTGES